MPAFLAEAGMPYWVDLMTSDAEKSAAFYAEVLGWELSLIHISEPTRPY